MRLRRPKEYHVGLLKDYHNPQRIFVQMRKNVDYLDCEIWHYLGIYETTKAFWRNHKDEVRKRIHDVTGHQFKTIIIE